MAEKLSSLVRRAEQFCASGNYGDTDVPELASHIQALLQTYDKAIDTAVIQKAAQLSLVTSYHETRYNENAGEWMPSGYPTYIDFFVNVSELAKQLLARRRGGFDSQARLVLLLGVYVRADLLPGFVRTRRAWREIEPSLTTYNLRNIGPTKLRSGKTVTNYEIFVPYESSANLDIRARELINSICNDLGQLYRSNFDRVQSASLYLELTEPATSFCWGPGWTSIRDLYMKYIHTSTA